MRILKNAALEARWQGASGGEGGHRWDRWLAGSSAEGITDAEREFLSAVKDALEQAKRLESQGAFRVLVRWCKSGEITVRAFRRDHTHPSTPDELDEPRSTDCVLFVDTRRIDGARRR